MGKWERREGGFITFVRAALATVERGSYNAKLATYYLGKLWRLRDKEVKQMWVKICVRCKTMGRNKYKEQILKTYL